MVVVGVLRQRHCSESVCGLAAHSIRARFILLFAYIVVEIPPHVKLDRKRLWNAGIADALSRRANGKRLRAVTQSRSDASGAAMTCKYNVSKCAHDSAITSVFLRAKSDGGLGMQPAG